MEPADLAHQVVGAVPRLGERVDIVGRSKQLFGERGFDRARPQQVDGRGGKPGQNIEHFQDFDGIDLPDPRAAVWDKLQNALASQYADGLAHGNAADAQRGDQCRFANGITQLQLALADQLVDVTNDAIDEARRAYFKRLRNGR